MNFSMNLLTAVATSADTLASDSAELPLPALTLVAVTAIAILYAYIGKALRNKKSAAAPAEKVSAEKSAAPSAVPMPAGTTQGELELIGTDEKTAAVIMAIVSNKSGIPLNRLSFKSIKLMEDK